MFAINWTQGLNDAWSKLAQTAPKIISFLLILVVGLIVARIVGGAITKLLKRIGADKFAEKFGIAGHLHRAGFTLSEFVGRAVRLFVVFITLTTAFAAFGPDNPVSKLLDRFVAYVPNIFVAGAILAITAAVSRFAASAVRRTMAVTEGAGTDVPNFLPTLATVAIWVVGGFAALDQLDVAPMIVTGLFYGALAIIVGVAIVAVGGAGIQPLRAKWQQVLDQGIPGLGKH